MQREFQRIARLCASCVPISSPISSPAFLYLLCSVLLPVSLKRLPMLRAQFWSDLAHKPRKHNLGSWAKPLPLRQVAEVRIPARVGAQRLRDAAAGHRQLAGRIGGRDCFGSGEIRGHIFAEFRHNWTVMLATFGTGRALAGNRSGE